MRTIHCAFALAVLLLLSPYGAGQETPRPPVPRQPEQFSTEQDITVFFDRSFAVSLEDVSAIIQSKQLAGLAIEELTGKRPQLSPESGHFGNIPGWRTSTSNKYLAYVAPRRDLIDRESGGSLALRLYVSVVSHADEDAAVAEKYAGLLVKQLNQVLPDLSRRAMELELVRLKSDAEQAQQAAEVASQKLHDTQKRVLLDSGDLSESSLQELLTDLTKQRQALEVALAGMNGRIEALQEQVARTAKRAETESADDEIVKNLMRVVELRAQQHRHLMELADDGVISKAELAKAEEQVALAKIELAQAKRAGSRSASEQLDKLNGELAQVTIGMSEAKSKLEFVSNRLEEQVQVLRITAEAKPLRVQLERQIAALADLRAQADQAAARVRKLESSFRPARVEFFELKPGKGKVRDDENVPK
jgi:hypothetical protein